MNTKYLYTMKTVLETGSYQKAASKLNYTQSTVTFHIQQIEQELDIKLFDRIGRKMVLTQAGREILPHIEAILQEEYALHNYAGGAAEMSGSLRIGMPDFLLCYKITPLIRLFQQQAPKVRLMIPALPCKEIRSAIINGDLDMGIHCNIGGYPKTIIEEPWSSYKARLVASVDAAADTFDFITQHQRKNVNLITSDAGSLHQQRLLDYCRSCDIILENNIDMGSLEAAKISVMNNLGIAYFPDFTVEKELLEGRLQVIQIPLDNVPVPVICAYHKNKEINPAMRLFKSLLFSFDRDAGESGPLS